MSSDSDKPPASSESTADSPEPRVGDLIDEKFRLIAHLGEGAMGKVFRAEQLHIERSVAVKFLHRKLVNDAESIPRFKREAQLACKLRDPHVVLVFDFGVWQGLPYLVMELAEGTTLRDLLSSGYRFSTAQLTSFARQVGSALREAHSLGIIHRDLKPENIVMSKKPDGSEWYRVLDFGLAKILSGDTPKSQNATRYGMFLGTPAYASPEQALAKEMGPQSDIYSLGAVMYEGVTGGPPYHAATDMELLIKHVQEPVPVLRRTSHGSKIDPKLAALVEKCLSKSPTERCRDAGLFVQELDALSGTAHAAGKPFEKREAMVGGAVLLLAVLGVWALFRSPGDGKEVVVVKATPTAEQSIEPAKSPVASKPTGVPSVVALVISPTAYPVFQVPTAAHPTASATLLAPTAAGLFPAATVPSETTASPKDILPPVNPTAATRLPAHLANELDKGLASYSAGRYRESIDTLEPVVRIDPAQVAALVAIALSYEQLKSCSRAEPPLQRAIQRERTKPYLYFYLARIRAQCGRPLDSIAALTTAIGMDPSMKARAQTDALFAKIANRPDFRFLVGLASAPPPRPSRPRRSRAEEFGREVGDTVSDLWYRLRR